MGLVERLQSDLAYVIVLEVTLPSVSPELMCVLREADRARRNLDVSNLSRQADARREHVVAAHNLVALITAYRAELPEGVDSSEDFAVAILGCDASVVGPLPAVRSDASLRVTLKLRESEFDVNMEMPHKSDIPPGGYLEADITPYDLDAWKATFRDRESVKLVFGVGSDGWEICAVSTVMHALVSA